MTDTTWINQPRWHALKCVDADFVERFQSDPAIQPTPCYENVRLQILLFAGRQAAAAVRIACSKSETELASIAEQAMLYEPFTYWDWQGYDAAGKSLERDLETEPKDLEGARRKRRLLWERERAFRVNGEWDEYPTPRERFEGFKRALEKRPGNKKFVKRFAMANWMTEEDLKWISSNLPRLEALDLSDVPLFHHAGAATWMRQLKYLSDVPPYKLETFDDHFTCLDEDPDAKSVEGENFLEFDKNAEDEAYRIHFSEEERRPHALYTKYNKARSHKQSESFEEFFWRLCERQERYEESRDSELSNELKKAREEIAESHIWRRLKWLGLRDWRSDSTPARLVLECIPDWAPSLKTVSIRGEYTMDRSSAEIPSVHHHVCRLIIGIEQYLPESVTSLELRFSVPFLRYLLEQLEKRKPNIKRVGIDLGAWVQIYPLRRKQDHLDDEDIRRAVRHVAHSETACTLFRRGYKTIGSYREDRLHGDNIDDYAKEQEYIKQQPNFYRDRSGDVDPGVPLPITEEDPPRKISGDDEKEDHYVYSKDLITIDKKDIHKSVHNCPLDTSENHTQTTEELDKTRADTLPKLLEKLHLARRATDNRKAIENASFRVDLKGKDVPKFRVQRGGAELFALDGEKENRSYDPIHPLTFIQAHSLAGVKSGSDYDAWSPDMLRTVYRWVERTFQWRPVFDWDWFMVPGNMNVTADPDLVNIAAGGDWGIYTAPSGGPSMRGKALQAALGRIKKQFGLLNEANIPVHILIGRRNPDMSSCYWGWPYTAGSWEYWVEQDFSANLEGIAEHVDVLSIFYDLRNPLDDDRLALIESRRPRYPPEGKCPTRVCPFKAGHEELCPFVRKYSALRNYHPRPQVKGLRKPPRFVTKPGLNFPKPVYGGLANGDASAPPTGEHADDHSKYDDSEAESREQWPLHLARHSVYARESVGWHRFWTAYATSLTRLTALRVRMPQSMDKVGSWALARLINRKDGWLLIDYTSERQHIQTEEDLFRDFASHPDPTPSTIYSHKKQSRTWPAGRFVRRSWVWDPLQLQDDRHTILTKRRDSYDPAIDGDDPDEIPYGKKYTAYTFSPRSKLDLTYPDPNLSPGDTSLLHSALRDVKSTLAAETEILDPVAPNGDSLLESPDLRVPQPSRAPHDICGDYEGRFRSAYGHHVRNVAGGQWREELREMIAFADRHMEGLRRGSFERGVMQESLWVDRERLRGLVRGEVPYEEVFRVERGGIGLVGGGDPFEGSEDEDEDTSGGGGVVEGSESGSSIIFGPSSDSDADSLFDDGEDEDPAVQTEQPLPDTQANTQKSLGKTPSGEQSGSKKPSPAGPLDTGSKPPSTGKEPGHPTSTTAPPPPPYQEPATRPTISTIDENYSDEDVSPTSKPSVTGISAGKQVASGAGTAQQAASDIPAVESGKESAEAEDESMTFMEWLSQKGRANAMAAAGGGTGEKAGTSAAGKTAVVEETITEVGKSEGKRTSASAGGALAATVKPQSKTESASAKPGSSTTKPQSKYPPAPAQGATITTVKPQSKTPPASEKPGSSTAAEPQSKIPPVSAQQGPSGTAKPQGKVPPASAEGTPSTTAKPESKTQPASAQPAPPKTDPKRKPPPTTAEPESKVPPASAKPGSSSAAEPQSKTPPTPAQPGSFKTNPKRKSPPTTAPAPPSKKPKPNPPASESSAPKQPPIKEQPSAQPSAASTSTAPSAPPSKKPKPNPLFGAPSASSANNPPPAKEPSAQPSAPPSAPSTGDKRKHPDDVFPPAKKPKTHSDFDAEDDSDEQWKKATGRKESKGQAEYVPTEEGDTDGESSDGGRRKKSDGKKKDEGNGKSGGASSASVASGSAAASAPATATAPPPASSSAPQSTPAPPPTPQPTLSIQVPPKADGSGPDYNRITVKNLRVLAKERGVSLKGASLKAQIVRKFEEEDEEDG